MSDFVCNSIDSLRVYSTAPLDRASGGILHYDYMSHEDTYLYNVSGIASYCIDISFLSQVYVL